MDFRPESSPKRQISLTLQPLAPAGIICAGRFKMRVAAAAKATPRASNQRSESRRVVSLASRVNGLPRVVSGREGPSEVIVFEQVGAERIEVIRRRALRWLQQAF